MCGIYGTISAQNNEIVSNFYQSLIHRGPDNYNVYQDKEKSLVLGHTRLSIIDLSEQSQQPMHDSTGQYVLIFNGEIYNYKELKIELEKLGYKFLTDSDTEVVLNSYIEWGQECVQYFRGMFAFCIYDTKKQTLFLSRDRFGIKPLIYTFLNGQFTFCSELKPLILSGLFPKKLCPHAVSDYFRFGSVRQPKTIFKDVFHLMPGHSMTVNLDLTYQINRYYNFVEEAKKAEPIHDYSEAVQTIRKELEIATKYHMVADVEVGAFLSGGVDSTSCVALMQQHSDKPINTFSIGFKQKEAVPDETALAELTAKKLGTFHKSIRIDDQYIENIFDDFIQSIDQPSIDGINTYIVSRETAKELKVALSGLGGDELFAGYPHFEKISNSSQSSPNIFSYIGTLLNKVRPNRFTNQCEYAGMEAQLALDKLRTVNPNIENILNSSANSEIVDINSNLSPLQRISIGEIDNYLLSTLLRDCDILSMAHSLEVRPVLLDHKLAEVAFNLPDNFKIKEDRFKAVFIDAVKDTIPKEVWNRKKTGFEMPFASWLNGKLNARFSHVAHSSSAAKLFNTDFLKAMQLRINQHSLSNSDWVFFVFLSWLETYQVEL
ncbi:MAG: asparagine synthase (glutamine-hydrolyzing) [Rhodomicrobiaceae bacterium]